MTITLTPEQQKRLEAAVVAGHFPSVEEAVRCAVDRLIALGEEDYGDLSWVKPCLEEARAEIARGETISLEEFNAHVEERLAKLR
jgi:Arc/MetJ-type ribon-helix-helix transcriptional regulator